MKVVVLGAKGLPKVSGGGGVERGVHEVARRLANDGHEVIVYERGSSFGVRNEDGIVVRSAPYIDRKNLAGWSHILVSLVDSLVRFRGVTAYHVHSAANGFVCLPLRLFTAARVIFHLHGAEWRVQKWNPLMAMAIRVSCVMGAIASHEVASVCARCVRVLDPLPFLTGKARLIPNGAPRRSLTRPADVVGPTDGAARAEPPFLLYAGRLVPQKRVDLLIRAFKQIEYDVRLLIVGPGSHCDAYVTQLKNLAGDDPRIAFLGQVDFATLGNLYRRSLAMVLPSDAEGCANVLLEALAYECCIVTSDIAENRAVVDDAAALFKGGDTDSLIAALTRVVVDGSENARLRRAARLRSQKLGDWDAVTKDFVRLYTNSSRARSTWPPPAHRGEVHRAASASSATE